jgi:hypothetical protein
MTLPYMHVMDDMEEAFQKYELVAETFAVLLGSS